MESRDVIAGPLRGTEQNNNQKSEERAEPPNAITIPTPRTSKTKRKKQKAQCGTDCMESPDVIPTPPHRTETKHKKNEERRSAPSAQDD